MRDDYPTNTTRGVACVYYKKCLALRVLNIVFLNECINFELRIGDKTYNFAVLYISPRQYQDVFESFCEHFERTLDSLTQNNFFLLVPIGYFDAKLPNWCENNQKKNWRRQIWTYSFAVWVNSNHRWYNIYIRLIFVLHRSNFYFSTRLSYWISCPSIITSKLSSSDHLR